jgi:hypothetical protein
MFIIAGSDTICKTLHPTVVFLFVVQASRLPLCRRDGHTTKLAN